LNIWLVKIGEPLPTDGPGVRLFRTGLLAQALDEMGHEVRWWTSTFNHAEKTQRARGDERHPLGNKGQLVLLRSPGYSRNVSLARLIDHRTVARKMRRAMLQAGRPDLILVALPVPGLCDVSLEVGRKLRTPVILDIRDLWPDVHMEFLPAWARGMGRVLLSPMRRQVERVCRGAVALSAPTGAYLEWGLRHASRERSEWDAVFPMGYPERKLAEAEHEQALAFWRDEYDLTPDGDDIVCCFFGALGHQFDLETVLRAARLLEDRGVRFRFVICGRGDRASELRAYAHGLGNVVFPGWVDYPKIRALMRIAQIGLAPYRASSLFERHLPNKPIEYMAGGLAIVSSLRGVVEKLLEEADCGVTYRKGDERQLAELLELLGESSQRLDDMGRNGLRVFLEKFRAEKVYREMAEHLVRVAGEWETLPRSS